jgi:hypothetical protein
MTKDKIWHYFKLFLLLLVSALVLFFIFNSTFRLNSRNIDIFGLEKVPETTIYNLIKADLKQEHSFLALPRAQLVEKISAHPLINSTKVRAKLLPQAKVQIVLEESSVWGYLKRDQDIKLIDQKGKISTLKRKNPTRTLKKILQVYEPEELVIVRSVKSDLPDKKLKILSEITTKLEEYLNLINFAENILEIRVDEDGEATLFGETLYYKIGKITKSKVNNANRILSVIDNLDQILHSPDYEVCYLDLSLKTSEVIIGKCQ